MWDKIVVEGSQDFSSPEVTQLLVGRDSNCKISWRRQRALVNSKSVFNIPVAVSSLSSSSRSFKACNSFVLYILDFCLSNTACISGCGSQSRLTQQVTKPIAASPLKTSTVYSMQEFPLKQGTHSFKSYQGWFSKSLPASVKYT